MLHTGLRIHGANLLLYIGAEVDKLVVIQWMDDASIGVYAVALAVSLAGSGLITQSLMVLAYPKISGAADKSQQVTLVCNFAQAAFLLLILINGAVALIAPWLVPMVFGVDFAAAVPVAMILLLMNTFRGARQVMERALRATLNTRLGMLSEGVGLACFAALAPIGGSLSGLAGIAWAMAGAQLLALGFMLVGMARSYKLSVQDLLGLRRATVLWLLRQMRQELWTLKGPWSR
jgi:O-antigen/teichoic acid export membrane protein